MDYLLCLKWAAILTTLILHIAPFGSVRAMMRRKTTMKMPFLAFVFNSLICVEYGLMAYATSTLPFLLLNICGFSLNAFYSSAYCALSKQKTSCSIYILLAINYIVILFYYLIQNHPSYYTHTLNFHSGIIVTIASLMPLPEVIKSYRVPRTPSHLLQLLILFNLASWVLYGHLLDNVYVSVPNSIGLVVQSANYAVTLLHTIPIRKHP